MKKLNPGDWNRTRAAHLLVRTGFGATPEQIVAAADKPMTDVVNGLFKTPAEVQAPDWVQPGVENKPDRKAMRGLSEEERRARGREMRREQGRYHRELINWWLQRMISGPCPLQEKMTLFWHGHFATSMRKVRAAYMMYLQNQTFRRLAMGNYRELVTAVSQDPAMLVYLDNTRSFAKSPNENFARELMELFTLGEGHYSEKDIKEAARAFTGWMVAPTKYEFLDAAKTARRNLHDDGRKEFFGEKGDFDGHDIIRIILEQKQASRYIVAKLWEFFVYPEPETEIVDWLAAELKSNAYELTPVLKSIFTCEAFYSSKALRTQIKSPVQWLAGSCIMLGLENPNPRICYNALRSLGQELFAPPNVKGWDGGFAWITTSSLTERYNLAAGLINDRPGRTESGARPFSTVHADTVLPETYRKDMEQARKYLEARVYQSALGAEERDSLMSYFDTLPAPEKWTDAQIRDVYRTMMSTPQFQLT